MTEEQKLYWKERDYSEWRQLGFYYDLGNDNDNPEWRFFGRKDGLKQIVYLLDKYVKEPLNEGLSEHEHYGPYNYLKIMTWNKPTITRNYIAGRLEDLKILKDIIAEKLSLTEIGQSFTIKEDYGVDNEVEAKFFVMPDNFDPASMDNFVFSESDN